MDDYCGWFVGDEYGDGSGNGSGVVFTYESIENYRYGEFDG